MGGNVSRETESNTIAAYTYYGFGCRCCNSANFVSGSPKNDPCGTSCSRVELPLPTSKEHQQALKQLETLLIEADDIPKENIDSCSYTYCAGVDMTSERAANALNDGWCQTQNSQVLNPVGLSCSDAREVFGFGRSRVSYVVIRVVDLDA